MKVFIIRHADANHETGSGDEYRPLTDRGRQQVERMTACCNQLGVSFGQIWTSNLLRAEETAERFAHGLDGSPPVMFNENLIPPGDFNGLRTALRCAKRSSIALVGHMPFLGECLQYWIGGNAHPGIALDHCMLVALDARGFNRHEMTLEYVIGDSIASRVLRVNG